MSALSGYFHLLLMAHKLDKIFAQEYKFHATRKWRFDFADPENKVAVEIDGGVFAGGRHTRGVGFRADCEKINAAAVLGWRVLRYVDKNGMRQFSHDYRDLLENDNKAQAA